MTHPASATPVHLNKLRPIEVAARLRALPGMVFFDSAGNIPADVAEPVSILSAMPTSILRGQIHHPGDREKLQAALTCGGTHASTGGLCGWVGYDGHFIFGDYPDTLSFSDLNGWQSSPRLVAALPPASVETEARIAPPQPLMTREEFIAGVHHIHEHIRAGDIYQVNWTAKFESATDGGSLRNLYRHLRECSPAPMAAWLALDHTEVLSSSPETFLRMSGREIETRPIKGTRPRDPDHPARDAALGGELLASAKERAELTMITDLLRNDLGQICEFASVEAGPMLKLESLAQVHHLVSVVKGRLRDEINHVDALAACFPGGSITGAPKRRAMEIIARLERVPRGIYCGAIGYFMRNGESQFNIAIRTLIREGSRLSFHAGAGIVIDSDPALEYEEIIHKAAGIREALRRFSAQSG